MNLHSIDVQNIRILILLMASKRFVGPLIAGETPLGDLNVYKSQRNGTVLCARTVCGQVVTWSDHLAMKVVILNFLIS